MARSIQSLRVRLLVAAALWSAGIVSGAAAVSGLRLRAHLERRHDGDRQRIEQDPEYAFVRAESVTLLGFLAVTLVVAGGAAATWAMRPLAELRERLAVVRAGARPRLDGEYPVEIEPVVREVNSLLAHNEAAVERAVQQADNLAHGLKTSLSVIRAESVALAAEDMPEAAARLERQVEAMRRQVDLQLARVRAVASGSDVGRQCEIGPLVSRLARTLERLHDSRVAIRIQPAAPCAIRGEAADFEEMLGNLLDNARKFGRSQVDIGWHRFGDEVVIHVDDDGPGLPPAFRQAVFGRGRRLDESVPGSGLGLAITRELVSVYGGTVSLDVSPAGGVRAVLTLPAAG